MVEPNSGCWLWTGSLDTKGYGQLSSQRHHKPHAAHRLSYELHHGPIGASCVLHKCDTPSCVNPNHLFLGSQQENMIDMHAKGRWKANPAHGERHGMSKLTSAAAAHIRERALSSKEYASLYGISPSNVRTVWRGKTWRE